MKHICLEFQILISLFYKPVTSHGKNPVSGSLLILKVADTL